MNLTTGVAERKELRDGSMFLLAARKYNDSIDTRAARFTFDANDMATEGVLVNFVAELGWET